MKYEKDFEDFIRSLNRHNVQYCIVGAFAVAFYGHPRYTKDIDIFLHTSRENAERVIQALADFGFSSLDLHAEDFTKEGVIIQLGYEPIRIDLLTSIDGIDFDDVWAHKMTGSYGNQSVFFISREDLIQNKKASNRLQDRVDVETLEKRPPEESV